MSIERSLIVPLLTELSAAEVFKQSKLATNKKLCIKWNVLMQNTLVEFIKINVNMYKCPPKDKVIYFRRIVNNIIYYLSDIKEKLKTSNVEIMINKNNRFTICNNDIGLISWLLDIMLSLRNHYQF